MALEPMACTLVKSRVKSRVRAGGMPAMLSSVTVLSGWLGELCYKGGLMKAGGPYWHELHDRFLPHVCRTGRSI
jgi:hypothetical protein